ncbi:amidohydrolase [Phenylobacterium montanum]|uniref:Amidohydrolase family protein n=1 Tax=Phenylobacterium montanum TaxID=2823693 RepID=A0A975FX60_9CAUL|nr:amidohydrolase family protein [Caulobacter sp. S6]QUD86572.1 amidohydrolase family protein [Caulobacter sp. S6]
MKKRLIAALLGASMLASAAHAAAPADYVLQNARIYTEDAARSTAQAMAVSGGKIVYVGDAAGAKALIGPNTRVEDGAGRLVLPGLVDAHIHPTGIADLDVCSFESKPYSLDAMAGFIQACIKRYDIKPGQWITVQQWNFSAGNEPSAQAPDLRRALDRAAPNNPVALLGNDGHHGAFNSLGLARAKNAKGQVVGYSRATIASDFKDFAKLIGVDAAGEPNGTVNEDARDVIDAPNLLLVNFQALMKTPQLVPERLNSVGITAMQDAYVVPEMQVFYDTLAAQGKLTVRVNLMQFYLPEEFRAADGHIEYDRLLTGAKQIRAKYAGDDLIRSEAIKIFADGVLEGNPYAVPPTLPDSPSLKPYLQPIFGKGADGKLVVKGYVDTASSLCQGVRAHPDQYESAEAVAAFMKANGYHPGQCAISSGKLQHDRQVILDYAKAAHLAGFTLHIHAIGDAAVRTAVDAIEGARAADGNDKTPDTIAHLQVVSPEDIARIGKDHLYLAYTYSWANADPEYDLTVVPFFEHVSGNSYADYHKPDSYYEKAFYPTKSTKAAGAILAAGSDAPVNTRDPQPFVNMQLGLTRAEPGLPPATPSERLTVRDVVDAYTIHGAQAMGRADEYGSLEVGKSADFILLDQDILALGDAGHADQIGKTKVLETWFKGQKVYAAKPQS